VSLTGRHHVALKEAPHREGKSARLRRSLVNVRARHARSNGRAPLVRQIGRHR